MYLLNKDGLAQWPTRRWPPDPWPVWTRGGGRSVTEDELIDDEIKHGNSVNNITDLGE